MISSNAERVPDPASRLTTSIAPSTACAEGVCIVSPLWSIVSDPLLVDPHAAIEKVNAAAATKLNSFFILIIPP